MDRWAYYGWLWLHGLASTRPNSTQFEQCIQQVPTILPCIVCSTHMRDYIKTHPDITDPVRWMFEFHNSVNKRLQKPEFAWSDVHRATSTTLWWSVRDAWLQLVVAGIIAADWSAQDTQYRINRFIRQSAQINGLSGTIAHSSNKQQCLKDVFDMYGRYARYQSLESMLVDFLPPSEYNAYGIQDPAKQWQQRFARRLSMALQQPVTE